MNGAGYLLPWCRVKWTKSCGETERKCIRGFSFWGEVTIAHSKNGKQDQKIGLYKSSAFLLSWSMVLRSLCRSLWERTHVWRLLIYQSLSAAAGRFNRDICWLFVPSELLLNRAMKVSQPGLTETATPQHLPMQLHTNNHEHKADLSTDVTTSHQNSQFLLLFAQSVNQRVMRMITFLNY